MEPLVALAGAFAILILGALLGIAVARRSSGKGAEAASLEARLHQLAETQAAAQAQMAQNLREQERTLAKMVDDRLADLGKRVSDRLQESSKEQQSSLSQLRERLATIDQAQKNITELSSQVVTLQDLLANKQARGAFGEVQLHDIVESVLPASAYAFQETLSNGRRVDCLLQLPNPPGPIAIDSKFPLESYQALREARDEAAATQARRALAGDMRKHVQDIAERYILPGETAESALLFLPSEAVYAELHANMRNVVEESFRHRVWIVSPTTLMATLNTVRAILKDVRMREQAHVIQDEVRKVLEDTARLDDRVARLQRHFEQAHEDVRQIRISTEKIQKRGERIENLQLEDSPGTTEDIAPTVPPRRAAALSQSHSAAPPSDGTGKHKT